MLIDSDVLIDAGTGIGDLPLDELKVIRHVFLTHAHLDHIAGLPLLADTVFDDNFSQPLTVYARRETLAALDAHIFNDLIWPDFRKLPSPERPILEFREIVPGETIGVGDRQFNAIAVQHSVPALGFTVGNSNGTLGVSGDTRANETLWPALNASDDLRALIIEVSFPDEFEALATESGHYCPRTMSRDLGKLVHRPDIWITGMKPGSEERILEQVSRAAPGHRVEMLSRGTVITV